MVEFRGIIGSRLCNEHVRRVVLVLAGLTAVFVLHQAWNNGYSPSFIYSSFARPTDVVKENETASYGGHISPGLVYTNSVKDGDNNNNSKVLAPAPAPVGLMILEDDDDNSTTGNESNSNVSNDNILSNKFPVQDPKQQNDVSLGVSHDNNATVVINNNVTSKNVSSSKEIQIGCNGTDLNVHQNELVWAKALEEQLAFAKNEIDKAPPVVNDLDLYRPLYHNVSRFKRSYEMMEKTFKVFVYPDGERPYFHTGPMTAIYASEGWFMKQMEENHQFITKDYRRAHMYYIPYSVYEMRRGIPAPTHQNMPQITTYLKDQIDKLASKYPYWNRTHGRDHFFVACHDWGPYTTKDHDELRQNAVKILCNADLSDGFFALGKDGGLPEINLRSLEQPPRGLGGLSPKNRSIFAFFAGGDHGRVRPILFKYWKDKDPDMKVYENLPPEIEKNKSYIQHMKESKYCLCPMGYEVSSPRMVEAIYYDCVPVIIADNFYLPFMEVIKWEAFSIMVAEKDIANLKDILLGVSERRYLSMYYRLSKVRKHFLWHKDSPKRYDVFHMILHSAWTSRLKMLEETKRE